MSDSKRRWHESCCWSDLHGFGEILLVSRMRTCVCVRDAQVTEGIHNFPRHAWSSGRGAAWNCSVLSKKEKKKNLRLNKLQAQYKTPKPIILSLREMKHKLSPHGINTEPDIHRLPPVLLSCSISLQSALLHLFNLHSIINPEPFVKPPF